MYIVFNPITQDAEADRSEFENSDLSAAGIKGVPSSLPLLLSFPGLRWWAGAEAGGGGAAGSCNFLLGGVAGLELEL